MSGPATLVPVVTILASAVFPAGATVPAATEPATVELSAIAADGTLPGRPEDRLAQLNLAPADVLTLPGYTPATDGFQFTNQGMTQFFSASEDQNAWLERLTAALPTLFGPQVCLDEETQPCVTTEAAQNWLSAQVELMAQGVCDGIAAANLMLWQTEGKPLQTWWQNWLSALAPIPSFDLLPTNSDLQSLVAQQSLLQGVDELYLPTQNIRENSTPNDILAELIATFRNAPENPYTLGVYRRQGNQLVEGHTLLPYRIEAQGDGQVQVYVYDSNLPPGDAAGSPSITFNTRENTWVYSPGGASGTYRGDPNSKNLDLTRLGWRFADMANADAPQGLFTCPFCAATQPAQAVDIALIGQGDLQVYRLNPTTNEYVSVGQNGVQVPFKGGLGRQVPARYSLTTRPAEPPLKVVISGKAAAQADLALQVTGSGYTAEFKPGGQISQDSLTLYLAVRAQGPELTVVADQDTVIPNLGIYLEDQVTTPPPDTTDPEPVADNVTQSTTTEYRKNVSYSMELGDIRLPAGHAVALSVDRDQKRFYFADNAPVRSRYTINIQSRTKEEQKTITETREDFPDNTFETQTLTERRTLRYEELLRVAGVELEPQNLAFFDYGDWAQVPTGDSSLEFSEEVEVPIAYSPAEFSDSTNGPLALVPQATTAATRLYRGNLIKSNYR